jgi:hypothetical protein
MSTLLSIIASGVTAAVISIAYNVYHGRKVRVRAAAHLARERSKLNHPSTIQLNYTGATPWNATISDHLGTRPYKIESEGR